jgi:hypothetical protein
VIPMEVRRVLTGDARTDDQVARDGARLVLSQIDKLRNQLDQAERRAQRVMAGLPPLKDDDAVWKRVRRAADKLLDGMA